MRRPLLALAFGSFFIAPACDSDENGEAAAAAIREGDGISAERGPVETLEKFSHDTVERNATEMWESLPASYRNDVNRIAQEFGYAMDDEIWSQGNVVVGLARDLLRDKPDYIAAYVALAGVATGQLIRAEEVTQTAAQLVTVLDALLASDLATTKGLENIDLNEFIAGPFTGLLGMYEGGMTSDPVVAEAMKEQVPLLAWLDAFKDMRPTLVSEDGAHAVVEVPDAENPEQTAQIELTRVGGKWIPAELARDWDSTLTMARLTISQVDFSQNKEEVLATLASLGEALQQMNQAENVVEFTTALTEAMNKFGLDAAGGAPAEGVEDPQEPDRD